MGKRKRHGKKSRSKRSAGAQPVPPPVEPAKTAAPAKPVKERPRRLSLGTGRLDHPRFLYLATFLIGFFLYLNTVPNQYAVDDTVAILKNRYTQQGLAGISGLLTHDSLEGFLGENPGVSGGRYRPLSLISFALEVAVFGHNPYVSHAVNAILYGLTGVLLLALLGKLLPDKHRVAGVLTTLVFICHPIHTDAVANIKGRDEVLAFLGAIGALYLAVCWIDRPTRWLLPAAGGVYFLALMSKENPITFLAVVPLALFVFRRPTRRQLAMAVAPLVIAAGIYLLLRGTYAGTVGDRRITELLNNPFLHATTGERIATCLTILVSYLRMMVWPHPMISDYNVAQVPIVSFGSPQAIGALILLAALAGWACWRIRARDAGAFAILYFFVTISLVSNLAFPIGTFMSERFAYMPSLGFCLVAGLVLERLRGWQPAVAASVLAVLLLAGSVLTIQRNRDWRDDLALYTADAAHAPNSARLNCALGQVLVEHAREEKDPYQRQSMLARAERHLLHALLVYPDYADAHVNLGVVYQQFEDWGSARLHYQQALVIDPALGEASYNLGLVCEKVGKLKAARQAYSKAIEHRYDTVQAQYNLAYVCQRLGLLDEAVDHYRQALDRDPAYLRTYNNLGAALADLGRIDEADKVFRELLGRNPDDAGAWQNLGVILLKHGRPAAAIPAFEAALRLKPGAKTSQLGLQRAKAAASPATPK